MRLFEPGAGRDSGGPRGSAPKGRSAKAGSRPGECGAPVTNYVFACVSCRSVHQLKERYLEVGAAGGVSPEAPTRRLWIVDAGHSDRTVSRARGRGVPGGAGVNENIASRAGNESLHWTLMTEYEAAVRSSPENIELMHGRHWDSRSDIVRTLVTIASAIFAGTINFLDKDSTAISVVQCYLLGGVGFCSPVRTQRGSL
jgi:hypothetical protein